MRYNIKYSGGPTFDHEWLAYMKPMNIKNRGCVIRPIEHYIDHSEDTFTPRELSTAFSGNDLLKKQTVHHSNKSIYNNIQRVLSIKLF